MTPLPEIPAELRALMAQIGPEWSTDTRGHVRLMIEAKSSRIPRSKALRSIRSPTAHMKGRRLRYFVLPSTQRYGRR
jgi:hypothetical protein